MKNRDAIWDQLSVQFRSGRRFYYGEFQRFLSERFVPCNSRPLQVAVFCHSSKRVFLERIDSLAIIKVTTLVTVIKERDKSITFRRKIHGYFEFTFLIML